MPISQAGKNQCGDEDHICSQTKLNEMITKKSYEQFSALLRIDVSVVEVGENIDTV